MPSRGRNRYQVLDDFGNVVRETTVLPKAGERFNLLEARADQDPEGGHYDGPDADLSVELTDRSVNRDTSG